MEDSEGEASLGQQEAYLLAKEDEEIKQRLFVQNVTVADLNGKSRLLAEFLHTHQSINYHKCRREQLCLRSQGINFKTGRWTNKEKKQLKRNWKRYLKAYPTEEPHLLFQTHFSDDKRSLQTQIKDTNFYLRLGKKIPRPMYSVYVKAHRWLNPGNYKGRYSKEEHEELKVLRAKYGNQWAKIGRKMGRSGMSVSDHVKTYKEGRATGKWSASEMKQLVDAVQELTDTSSPQQLYYNLPWTEIAKKVPTRTAVQCRGKWLGHVAFPVRYDGENPDKWKAENKICLLERLSAMNVVSEWEIDWDSLLPHFDNAPSPQFLMFKWQRMKHKVPFHRKQDFADALEYLEEQYLPVLRQRVQKQQSHKEDVGS